MMVNGPLEIYGVVIGLKTFDAMFNVLAQMGVLFIPILVLLFQNITTPYESEIENGASTSLRRVGIHLGVWIFTVMLFVAPTWKVDIKEVTYKPACASSAQVSKFGDTGTTYDDVFAKLDYEDIRMPIMMAVVLNGISGFTNAMIVTLPCKTDVQAMQNVIDTTRLTPALSHQVQRFENECFAPAKASFMSHPPDKSSYQDMLNKNDGQTDLAWIGSHVLQSLYYGKSYPHEVVPGFSSGSYPGPYAEYNKKHGLEMGEWGYPTCKQWWSEPNIGLESQIAALVSKHDPQNPHLGEESFSTKVKSWLAKAKQYTHLGSQVTANDVIVHNMLYDPGSNSGFGRTYTGWMNVDEGKAHAPIARAAALTEDNLSTGVAYAGQAASAAEASVTRRELDSEIPILQAVLLAFTLAVGPIIICLGLIGGKGISVICTYYFLVGSMLFMTFIEKFVHYLEMSLHASQSYSIYAMGNDMIMYSIFTKIYFYAPMLFLMMMSICGVALGQAVSQAFSDGSHGGGAKKAMSLLKFIPK